MFTFKIRKTNFNGTYSVYRRTCGTQTNDGGLISLIIGGGTTQMMSDLSNITWSNDKYFLEVFIDGNSLGSTSDNECSFRYVCY